MPFVTSTTFCPTKKGGERKKKTHKGNNRGVARLQILSEQQPSFVLPLLPLWRMSLRSSTVRMAMLFLWGRVPVLLVAGMRVRELSVCPFGLRVRKASCRPVSMEECTSWGETVKALSSRLTDGMSGQTHHPLDSSSPLTSLLLSPAFMFLHTDTWISLFYSSNELCNTILLMCGFQLLVFDQYSSLYPITEDSNSIR